jgi:hypothetical protein
MATLDMAAINRAATEISSHPWTSAEALGPEQPFTAVALGPPIADLPSERSLDEPSSLALALIGVAALAAYRALVHQVVGSPAARPAPQTLVQPRRRAA